MNFSIISSEKDIAGMNIAKTIISNFNFIKKKGDGYYFKKDDKEIVLHIIKEDTIYFDAANNLDADYIIFATRHQSKSGEKTLSMHFPGNFSKAEYGGIEKKFCIAAAPLLKQAFINLDEIGKDSGYNITLEATHHGPLLRKPTMFIEIGSREEQWKDEKAAEIISKTIMKTIIDYEKRDYETAIGFGGLHYCQNFNEIELGKDIALGHICPKYHINNLDEETISGMLTSSDLPAKYALLDWKGIQSEDKQKLVALLDKLGIAWKKTKDVNNK